jgi:hypothetical protein
MPNDAPCRLGIRPRIAGRVVKAAHDVHLFAHLSRRRDEGFEATFADQVMKLSMAALCLGDLRTPVR